MVNFLEETQKALKNHGFSFRNIRCIRNAEGYIPIADFENAAYLTNYDNGYGEVEIDPTLVIIGSFWWFTRANYDGKEGWVYHHKPKKPALRAGNYNLRNTRKVCRSTFEEEVEFFEGGNE